MISFGWLLGTVVFNTAKTSLWQSERPVDIAIVRKRKKKAKTSLVLRNLDFAYF